jgi:rSAM/selenodomain-associated transferase 1
VLASSVINEVTLIQIFCKPPIAGQVKTRLVPELGEAGALALYEEMLSAVVRRTGGFSSVELWSTAADAYFERFNRPVCIQQGIDLGARMAGALEQGLTTSGQVILIGSDVPAIDAAYLENAIQVLSTHDVVLGPAADGGYGLVGVNGAVPDMFADIVWSTDTVFEETCRHLNRLEVNYALLPEVWDVDRPEDLAGYYNRKVSPRACLS